MRRILLLGPPRSGSTWVSEVLSATPRAVRVHEPDNERNQPFALVAKAGLGRYPLLADHDRRAQRYGALWDAVFTNGNRRRSVLDGVARGVLRTTDLSTCNAIVFGHRSRRAALVARTLRATARPASPIAGDLHVIKSVHSATCAGYVAARTDARVVVIRRSPLNAVPSWLELGWRPQHLGADPDQERRFGERIGARPPPESAPIIARQAWSFAALTRALDLEAARHPHWIVVQHEDLCNDPTGGFRQLFEDLDLDYGPEAAATVDVSDRPATGYTTHRVARDQAERWKHRLTDEQIDVIRATSESLSVDC